jgi:hypothetical protein
MLTHGQSANQFSTDQARQVFLLLLRIPVEHQLVDTQLAMRRIAQPYTPAGPRQLLHNNAVCLVSHGEPAKLFVGCYTQEAGFAKLLPHLVGEFILLVGTSGELFWDFALGKVTD